MAAGVSLYTIAYIFSLPPLCACGTGSAVGRSYVCVCVCVCVSVFARYCLNVTISHTDRPNWHDDLFSSHLIGLDI